MFLEILFVVVMAIWFIGLLPVTPLAPYAWANSWLAFLAVLLLGVFLFIPNARW